MLDELFESEKFEKWIEKLVTPFEKAALEHLRGRSKEIAELATALAVAQGQMEAAPKDGHNTHSKYSYATIASIISASRKPLSDNGLAVTQIINHDSGAMELHTILLHKSGQFLRGVYPLSPVGANTRINDAQQMGMAITYARKYTYAAMIGVAVEDGDGDTRQLQNRGGQKKSPPRPATKSKPKTKSSPQKNQSPPSEEPQTTYRQTPPTPATELPDEARYTPQELQAGFAKRIESWRHAGYADLDAAGLRAKRIAIVTSIEACFKDIVDVDASDYINKIDGMRRIVQEHLTGTASLKDMDSAQIHVLHQWCRAELVDDEWLVSGAVVAEARAIYELVTSPKSQGA